MTDPIVAALRELDSCAVSDALDTLGLPGAVTALSPRWPSTGVTAGRVRTVTAAPKAAAGPATHIATPLVAVAEPDDVVVIDNHGRTDVSCWGGLLAEAAARRGVAGVIVDGACRDVQESAALGLPLYARTAVPVSARGRIVQQAADERIQVAGVPVASYDYVIADVNGVVFVAADQAERVVRLARRIADREERMAEAVRAGRDVSEVMHDSQFPTVTAEEQNS
ncbi:RraA family protein [Microbacterium azadirachtae]|uniref:RraA family protein n=1 Tax=Microbacterium azadirachtae TaxID=582680 RepID=UPI00087EADD8|nr:4-carboxy-4-hydroxy-2-oxoadipate aldolase/oxaloacetate decarboxylase [Microbacterium azadirachtae]SDM14729.1 Regulator of RNase E activity RraA [Microbacterium azadirachtae]SEG38511.1 Regulator of RNase E activity RraA [Microbacterium azadirachtae]SEG41372.1 Regulator of RNase E activity RraA [Microbacterium azadirachtae]